VLIQKKQNNSSRGRWGARLLGSAVVTAALAVGASGCAGRFDSEVDYGYPTTYVQEAPANIYAYPREPYRGGYAYLVGDSWYYEGPRGWVLFQSAPRELEQRRVHIVRERSRRPAPRYYEQRRAPAYPREPVEHRRRYYRD
jgi:hypothetical protein